MKFKLTINVETDAEHQNLNITYKRKDIVPPESVDDKLLAKYIESLVRYTIDNGFANPTVKGKEEQDGEEVGK